MAAFRLLLFALALHLFFYSSFAKKKPKVKISIEAKPPDCREEDGAKSGDSLVVHYTGALENGQIFDTSKREGREPFEITLGEGRVIPGWEQGLIGVCSGEVRKLIIPHELGYGERGIEGIIPPKAMLVFHIEVLEVKKQSLISVGSILPSGSGFYMILAVFALIGFGSYELYKRYAKQSQEEKQFKKSKKKNKR